MRILVVDDASIVRTVLRAILEKHGHEVIEAATIESSITLFNLKKPNFVFMDFNMGEDSGVQLFLEVNEMHPEIPFVLITASDQPELSHVALRLGIREVLHKPINADSVLMALKQHGLRKLS